MDAEGTHSVAEYVCCFLSSFSSPGDVYTLPFFIIARVVNDDDGGGGSNWTPLLVLALSLSPLFPLSFVRG